MGKPFFDSNVVVYAFSRGTDPHGDQARTLLADARGVVSVQVLNEFVSVARRKLAMTWREIEQSIAALCVLCPRPVRLTVETQESAIVLAKRYGYHIHDANIIASALEAGCDLLYSEDLRDGQAIGDLTIRNPFH